MIFFSCMRINASCTALYSFYGNGNNIERAHLSAKLSMGAGGNNKQKCQLSIFIQISRLFLKSWNKTRLMTSSLFLILRLFMRKIHGEGTKNKFKGKKNTTITISFCDSSLNVWLKCHSLFSIKGNLYIQIILIFTKAVTVSTNLKQILTHTLIYLYLIAKQFGWSNDQYKL